MHIQKAFEGDDQLKLFSTWTNNPRKAKAFVESHFCGDAGMPFHRYTERFESGGIVIAEFVSQEILHTSEERGHTLPSLQAYLPARSAI